MVSVYLGQLANDQPQDTPAEQCYTVSTYIHGFQLIVLQFCCVWMSLLVLAGHKIVPVYPYGLHPLIFWVAALATAIYHMVTAGCLVYSNRLQNYSFGEKYARANLIILTNEQCQACWNYLINVYLGLGRLGHTPPTTQVWYQKFLWCQGQHWGGLKG